MLNSPFFISIFNALWICLRSADPVPFLPLLAPSSQLFFDLLLACGALALDFFPTSLYFPFFFDVSGDLSFLFPTEGFLQRLDGSH